MRDSHGVEVADIFRQYGPAYRATHQLPRNHLRTMSAIETCRTSALGGHVDECDSCGHQEISYNSCRNRHCPKCQFLRKEKWIADRAKDLLPIQYFHVVCTIPSELNTIVLSNQKVMYDLLFRSVSETLITLGNDPKHLGARIGFIGILHTWGQNLMDHPHIHCAVTGGGLSPDGNNWIAAREKFFIHVNVISDLFCKKFLAYLRECYESGELRFPGTISHLKEPHAFERFRRQLYRKEWYVYSKPPFNGIEGVLNYISRYTHRIAISNHRILKIQDGKVLFRWRDYRDGNKEKTMALEVDEFIRRFLLHVLPDRYIKIRHYGLLANRIRKDRIALCRELLCTDKTETRKDMPTTWQERFLQITGVDLTKCPVCTKGRMVKLQILKPVRCNSPPIKN